MHDIFREIKASHQAKEMAKTECTKNFCPDCNRRVTPQKPYAWAAFVGAVLGFVYGAALGNIEVAALYAVLGAGGFAFLASLIPGGSCPICKRGNLIARKSSTK